MIGLFMAGVGGGFVPWVWRDTVALQLTAPGLAEFVKFLPEVRTGQLTVQRLYFLLPLFWAMLALPILAENQQLRLPTWLRWGLRSTVIPMALVALPPVWSPPILLDAEFRIQTILALLAMSLTIISPLLRHLPLKELLGLFWLIGLASLMLSTWQFSLVQAAIVEAYHEPISFGPGWWLTVISNFIVFCALIIERFSEVRHELR